MQVSSCLILTLLSAGFAAPSIVPNGGFEQGMQGWLTNQSWYEQPQGAGLSQTVVADGEGRDGSKALKIVGGGKRGIAMAVLPAYPGKYRVTGWIKCQDLTPGNAGVLAEWLDGNGKWMRADWAVRVKSTTDWQHFDTTLEPPAGTRTVHLDLITTEPNEGTVWFDDIAMERVASDLPAPKAPALKAATPEGGDGCLEVTWDPKALAEGTIWLMIYCEDHPLGNLAGLTPRAVLDAAKGTGTVWSLEKGKRYYLAAVAVNGDMKASPPGPAAAAPPADREAPRPGFPVARRTAEGGCVLGWTPFILDHDVKTLHIVAPGTGAAPGAAGASGGQVKELKAVDVSGLRAEPRPIYCTQPWLQVDVTPPQGATKLGVWVEDKAGNRGQVAWTDIEPAPNKADLGDTCALWEVPPTDNLPRDARPFTTSEPISLDLMRGEAKGFQVALRSTRDLQGARVVFEPLEREGGGGSIDTRWLAYHFVDYVHLDKNSIDTPPSEQVWAAPADFPDQLSDDPVRDLSAGQTEPIFIRVTAPRGAAPGVYKGRGWLETREGRKPFGISVKVEPITLPKHPQLKFVYWFSWADLCKQFGVDQNSADGWRALYELGRLMTAYHQNAVVVPWSLVKTWRRPDGTYVHDFRDFDRYIRTFQAAGVDKLFCLSHIGGRTTGAWECPTMSPHQYTVRELANGQEEQDDVIGLLPALQAHIEKLGLIDHFALHIADEPIPQNVASYRELSARAHKAAPKLRRIDAIHVPDLKGALEIWVPQLNYFEQWLPQYRAAQKEGYEIWFYVAWVPQGKFPNRMIDGGAIKPRILHWLNGIYDTSGYLHWALNQWHISLTSLNSPGDQYIVWPSKRFIANSSLRYEAEREGLDDCELMFMLRDHYQKEGLTRAEAQKRMEAIARQAVPGIEDYTRSWAELEHVRAEMLRALETPAKG